MKSLLKIGMTMTMALGILLGGAGNMNVFAEDASKMADPKEPPLDAPVISMMDPKEPPLD